MRNFDTGATRDSDDYKPDFDGFLSEYAIEAYGQYMHQHRKQADGNTRSSDNWKKGIPIDQYIKSLLRHVFDLWRLHRGVDVRDRKTGEPLSIMDACCGSYFNLQGYMHETLKLKKAGTTDDA